MKSNQESSAFQVVWSARVKDNLKNMSARATAAVRKRLGNILRGLDGRLAEDP